MNNRPPRFILLAIKKKTTFFGDLTEESFFICNCSNDKEVENAKGRYKKDEDFIRFEVELKWK